VNDYTRFIEAAPLISQIESTTSSGDLNYQGTAMEVSTTDGDELFHVVVDISYDIGMFVECPRRLVQQWGVHCRINRGHRQARFQLRRRGRL
jgi:hypothetical protein